MTDTFFVVMESLREAAKELPALKDRVEKLTATIDRFERLQVLQAEEARELGRILEEHAHFMKLHFNDLREVLTHPRRQEVDRIIVELKEMA